MTFTDRDMREQVIRALGIDAVNFHIEGIVDELQRKFGTVEIDHIDSGLFWEIVQKHVR